MQRVFWKEYEKIFRSEVRGRFRKPEEKTGKSFPKKDASLKKSVPSCSECPVSGLPVPPEGYPGGAMFVGMLPGSTEDFLGRPFVGKSGQLLRTVLKSIGFEDRKIYLTNVIKCRLTDSQGKNRDPLLNEIKKCSPFLLEEIKELNPKVIVLLGDVPFKFFFNRAPISKYRGMLFTKGDYKFVPTYHPAFILRNRDPDLEKLWRRDLEYALRILSGSPIKEKYVERIICSSNDEVWLNLNRIISGGIRLRSQVPPRYTLDIETWSSSPKKEAALDPWSEGFRIDLVSLSFKIDEKWIAFCIPLEHPESTLNLKITISQLEEFFRKCKEKNIGLMGQSIKWDLKVLEKRFGLKVDPCFDTLVAHALLVGGKSGHSLERMSIDILGIDSHKDILRQQLEGKNVTLEALSDMCMSDCVNTSKLQEIFEKELKDISNSQSKEGKEWNILRYHNEIIIPGIRVLKKMELRGMPVNADYLQTIKRELEFEIESIRSKIFSYPELSGKEDLKLSSTYDLNKILYDFFKFSPISRKTVAGYAVDKSTLEKLESKYNHPVLADLQNFKLLVKLHSTYVKPYMDGYVRSDGRIHGVFNQHIAMTGRLSMEKPNLQNIPVRIGPLILSMFEAREGWSILVADYSQIELRVMAAYSGSNRMIRAFKNNEDIHLLTASEVHQLPLDSVTPEQRQDAKSINFGIIYGMSDKGLSESLDISLERAHEYRRAYLDTYDGIEEYMEERKREYRIKGFVETLFGRRIYIRGNDEEHNERRAINGPIQGTASDINQKSLIDLDSIIESGGYLMGGIDVIHDSQVYEIPDEELEIGKKLIAETMENLDLSFMKEVPLKVDIGVGKNLGDASSSKG